MRKQRKERMAFCWDKEIGNMQDVMRDFIARLALHTAAAKSVRYVVLVFRFVSLRCFVQSPNDSEAESVHSSADFGAGGAPMQLRATDSNRRSISGEIRVKLRLQKL